MSAASSCLFRQVNQSEAFACQPRRWMLEMEMEMSECVRTTILHVKLGPNNAVVCDIAQDFRAFFALDGSVASLLHSPQVSPQVVQRPTDQDMSTAAHPCSGLLLRANRSVTLCATHRACRQSPCFQRPFSARSGRHICQRRSPCQCAHKNGEDKAGHLLTSLSAAWCCSLPHAAGHLCNLMSTAQRNTICVHSESAESLFQKELNRRGINGSSLDTDGEKQLELIIAAFVCIPAWSAYQHGLLTRRPARST